MDTTLEYFQDVIGVNFINLDHLKLALIHRSYINENKALNLSSNERYEFLGDAILELWTSKKIFDLFPNYNEGQLTNLRAMIVRTETLALISKKINLNNMVRLSRGEESHGGRDNQSILADAFEALIGAIYLDRGWDSVDTFLSQYLLPTVTELAQAKVYKDPKSLFQEIAQAKRGITPHYQTISESGPDHAKTFEVGVFLGEELITTGMGPSKQAAEESASSKATKMLEDLV